MSKQGPQLRRLGEETTMRARIPTLNNVASAITMGVLYLALATVGIVGWGGSGLAAGQQAARTPVVLLGGESVAGLGSELARRFDTIALDASLPADQIAAVLVEMGVERADLVGVGDGGAVVQLVAARHPALVRKHVALGGELRGDALVAMVTPFLEAPVPGAESLQ
jgi:pimeloyl-ACP methyl ester carboxylesterase